MLFWLILLILLTIEFKYGCSCILVENSVFGIPNQFATRTVWKKRDLCRGGEIVDLDQKFYLINVMQLHPDRKFRVRPSCDHVPKCVIVMWIHNQLLRHLQTSTKFAPLHLCPLCFCYVRLTRFVFSNLYVYTYIRISQIPWKIK